MKKIISLLSLTFLLLTISSCKKVEYSNALIGVWYMDKFTENGSDRTDFFNTNFPNYSVTFNKDHSFSEHTTILGLEINVSGTWKIKGMSDKLVLKTTLPTSSTRSFDMKKLTATEFYGKLVQSANKQEYFLKR